MKKKPGKRSGKAGGLHWVRASISFPPDMYQAIEELARQKKVSLAWIVRDAIEEYSPKKRLETA